jgi:hypothetical protein
MARGAEDVHPYLRSVKYPFADPSRWRHETSMSEIAAALVADPDVASAVAVPRPLERIEILETGESPRVLELRLEGGDRDDTMSGKAFAKALGLPSTWFGFAGSSKTGVEAAAIARSAGTVSLPGTDGSRSWPLAYIALLLATIAVAVVALEVLGTSNPGPFRRLQTKAEPLLAFARGRRKGV